MCDPLISPDQFDAIRSKLQKMILNLRLRSRYTQTVHLLRRVYTEAVNLIFAAWFKISFLQ